MKTVFVLLVSLLGFTGCEAQDKKNNNKTNQNDMIVEAVKTNKPEAVKALLKEDANVESRDTENHTLLLIATHQNAVEVAKILVAAGANVNAQDSIKDSPFLYAGAQGRLELVKLYLANGADFTVFNRYGGSALIPAAEKGHIEVVRLLSSTKGFPVNHVNNLGWTALMEAVVLGTGGKVHTEIVQILIDAGCDITIPDFDGVTALTHAKNRGFKEIAAILEAAAKRN